MSEEIFSIGLNRAITLIAEAKPGRISSSDDKRSWSNIQRIRNQ